MGENMSDVDALVELMKHEVPPGQATLPERSVRRLRELTAELLAARPECTEEFRRYLGVRQRSIPVPDGLVETRLRGRRIVVTGGSGCVGTELLALITGLGAEIVSGSITPPERTVPGVRYERLDIRDGGAVRGFLRRHRPDVVFHLAAQRDPGLAERAVCQTVCTNVLGTRNVADAAEAVGVTDFVYASTGKALRPYTSDVYAESKRMGEWVIGRVASRGAMNCTGVRFTHVVDNAIVLRRFRRWARTGRPIRLHSPHMVYYAQSALESAQLMLVALAEPADSALRMCMISDLGWPVRSLDVALGVIRESGGAVPLYLAGYDPGYEKTPYPGLYDPRYSGDISPLINAIEAPLTRGSASPAVDVVPMPSPAAPGVAARLSLLDERCAAGDDGVVRALFDEAAWDLLSETLRVTPARDLQRVARMTAPHRAGMTAEHLRMDDLVRLHAGADAATAAVPTRRGGVPAVAASR
jgi:nucleoside-diphosphate-sugar epimerase